METNIIINILKVFHLENYRLSLYFEITDNKVCIEL